MGNSEQSAATESAGKRQYDTTSQWLSLLTGSATAQANLLATLTRATARTGQMVQRQNAALARTWLRAVTGTGSRVAPVSAGPADQSEPADQSGPIGQSSTDEQRQEGVDTAATAQRIARTRATEATESPIQQATAEAQPSETTGENQGGVVAATTGRSETSMQEQQDSDQSGPPTKTERIDAASDLDQLGTLGPIAAERLRSADVHTIEELARARTKDLAAETGLHPRRVRVWVFRARRVSDW